MMTDANRCCFAYSVMLLGDDVTTHLCLLLAEMMGCQVGKRFLGN